MILQSIGIPGRDAKNIAGSQQESLGRLGGNRTIGCIRITKGDFEAFGLAAADGKGLRARTDGFRVFDTAGWKDEVAHDVADKVFAVPVGNVKGLSGSS